MQKYKTFGGQNRPSKKAQSQTINWEKTACTIYGKRVNILNKLKKKKQKTDGDESLFRSFTNIFALKEIVGSQQTLGTLR